MKRILSVTILITAAFIAACKGPAGATGPQGATGAAGAQGPQGPQGPTGNANIISGADTAAEADWSASWAQLQFSNSNSGTAGGDEARYIDFPVPADTGATFNSGAVLVWMQSDPVFSPTKYVQLPYKFKFVLNSTEYNYQLELTPGNIRVWFYIVDLNNPTTAVDPTTVPQATRIFRWVIIPPAAASVVPSLHPAAGPDATVSVLRMHGFNVEPGRMP